MLDTVQRTADTFDSMLLTRRELARSRRWIASALAVAALGVASTARADIQGFDSFAPINYNAAADPAVTYNGYYPGSFQVTAQGVGSQAVSGFAADKQNITSFVAKYTYLATHTGNPADGLAFLIHNDPRGTTALGNPGGAAGYQGAGVVITPSFAMHLGLFFPNNGALSTATNGTTAGFFYTGDVNTQQQYPVDFTFSYFGNTLTTTMRAGATSRIYTRSDAVNLPSVVGADTAFIGFSGGTGGATATQQVQNFTFKNVSGNFTPLKFNGGFTHDVIVEVGATDFQTAVTATMDRGNTPSATTGLLEGATFYEKGFNTAAPTTGLPSGGVLTGSATDALHSFAVQSAAGNNAVLLNSSNAGGTLTLETPTEYKALSFLTSTGNGSGTFNVRIIHGDGSPDELLTNVGSPDWFNGGGTALTSAGRVNPNMSFSNVNETNPRLYQQDIVLTNQESPITAMEFTYVGGAGNTYIFGVSGVTEVPEPASLGLLAVGGMALLRRRRRHA